MPKLLVLVAGTESSAMTSAESVADAAKAVRFTEVDVRVVDAQGSVGVHAKTLQSAEAVHSYNGVIMVSSGTRIAPELQTLLDELERAAPNTFANTVFSVAEFENGALLERVARLGGIIVTEARGETDPGARASALGARTAKVAEWVRHALSHEHGHDHGHDHGHQHAH